MASHVGTVSSETYYIVIHYAFLCIQYGCMCIRMCLTFVMLKANAAPDEWQLILINNRDEDFNRPTEKAHWDGHILCSTDLKGGTNGTWLGISRRGRIGVLLNIMEPICSTKAEFSRGNLVKEYLQSACDPLCYLQEMIVPHAQKYNGFVLLLLERRLLNSGFQWNLFTYSNQSNRGIESFFTGVYGFGNSVPDLPFLKVKRGLKRFENIVLKSHSSTQDPEPVLADLLNLLKDTKENFPDDQLQSQGAHYETAVQKRLSRCFYDLLPYQEYGTRTHSIILIDGSGRALFVEENRCAIGESWTREKLTFELC